jgi:hypothetical protein
LGWEQDGGQARTVAQNPGLLCDVKMDLLTFSEKPQSLRT